MIFATSRRSPRGDSCKFPAFNNSFLGEDGNTTPQETVAVDDPDENSEGTKELRVSFPFLVVVDRLGEAELNIRRRSPRKEVEEVWERDGDAAVAGTLGRSIVDGAGFASGSERLRASPTVGSCGGYESEEGG